MDVPEFTPEERDARTVICMQLASRICSEDLEEFFSSIGKVIEKCLAAVKILFSGCDVVY